MLWIKNKAGEGIVSEKLPGKTRLRVNILKRKREPCDYLGEQQEQKKPGGREKGSVLKE